MRRGLGMHSNVCPRKLWVHHAAKDDDTTEYPNYKSYKMNNIKILLYNNQDKITKDIALLLD